MRYYGQNREDEWIDKNLPLPDKGFYVDIGCEHPFNHSNTAFLRDRGWKGLAIDGNRETAKLWINIPDFRCAVISSHAIVNFREDSKTPGWSRISQMGEMRGAITIEELLEFEHVYKIDFLSVDVEGSEMKVLQSFNFEKHDPSIVIVEYNAAHLPIVEALVSPIPPFMMSKGYELRNVFGYVNMVFAK